MGRMFRPPRVGGLDRMGTFCSSRRQGARGLSTAVPAIAPCQMMTITADGVRHGEAPNITVDKNGVTCGAGAGSIQCGSYHGFLRNGELVP
jgi:hypothetical protein